MNKKIFALMILGIIYVFCGPVYSTEPIEEIEFDRISTRYNDKINEIKDNAKKDPYSHSLLQVLENNQGDFLCGLIFLPFYTYLKSVDIKEQTGDFTEKNERLKADWKESPVLSETTKNSPIFLFLIEDHRASFLENILLETLKKHEFFLTDSSETKHTKRSIPRRFWSYLKKHKPKL